MNKNLPIRFIIILFIFSLFSSFAFGQSQNISGKIIDKDTKEALIGANLILNGTTIGAASDINGEFYINNVPVGKYKLKASYIGYDEKIFDINVTSEKSLELNIELASQTLTLDETVTVTAQRTGQVAAINQQLTAEALVNVVSSEKILEFPDANVAESVARLPGVSLIRDGGEGSGVVVRGLSPKFSKITVDGVDMASTGANTRGANLSGISQQNLKGIELFKSPTADMDGEAIGGTINLKTGKASEKQDILFRAFGYYNELENTFAQYSLFGKYSSRFLDDDLGLQASVNLERRDRSSDIFSGSYQLGSTGTNGIAPLEITSSSVTDRLETRERIGGNLILDYNLPNGYLMFSSFLNKTSRTIYNRQRQISISNVSGRQIMRETNLDLQSYVNTLRGEHNFWGLQNDWSLSFSYSRNERPFDHYMRFNERVQLPNQNDVPLQQNAIDYYNYVSIDSSAAIDIARFNQEDVQERNFIGQLNFQYDFSLSSNVGGYIKFGAKYKHINRDRAFTEAQLWGYLYEDFNYLRSSNFLDNDYKPNNFLRGKANLGVILDIDKNREFYEKYSDSPYYINNLFYAYRSSVSASSGIPNYQSKENVSGFYIMPKLKYKNLITLIPGLRYETVDNKYFGANYYSLVSNSPKPRDTDYFLNDTTAVQNYNDLLPMIHLKIQPTEWFDVRFSYTKTLSRPNYNWLIPSQSLSTFSGVNIYKGNSELKPARAYSYDVYASFYEPKLGLISVGYFNKKIDDISTLFTTFVTDEQIENGLPEFGIEPLKNNQNGYKNLYNGNNLRTPINLPQSTVKGFEIELQTNFQLFPVPDFLKGIVLGFNYSIIESNTFFPWSKTSSEIVVDPLPRVVTTTESGLREGKVPGQADRLMNLSIGYDYKGFSGRVSMFSQSESVESVGTQKELDTYTAAFTRWDVSLKQSINEHLDIFLNGVNLSNNQDEVFQSDNGFNKSLNDYGRSFELGLQYRL